MTAAEKQLSQNAEAVHRYNEEKAKSLVKAAAEAASRQKAAATALKTVQDKLRAAQEEIGRIKDKRANPTRRLPTLRRV